jgi:hypothetical protein
MSFTNWNPVQACLWIARRDESAVASLRSNHTFAELAWAAVLDDSDPKAPVIEPGMTYLKLWKALDAMPQKAKSTWIGNAQRELLRACYHGALKMTGRRLSGGSSQEIPAPAFHGMEFYDELPHHIAGEFENERSHILVERLSSLEKGGGVLMSLPDVARNAADCWIDLRLQADQVRSVWPKDGAQNDTGFSETSVDAWLRPEMLRRRRVGEPKDRDTMVVAMMTKFPDLPKTRAKAIFRALPRELKERPGPRPGSRRNRNTGPNDSSRCQN